jgi:exodeoxyribonuclease VII small subunit
VAEIPADIAKMNFEDALKELEGIVRQLEEGKGRLDEAIEAYARGALLKRHCEAKLAEAEARIDRIVVGPDGAVTAAPANLGS